MVCDKVDQGWITLLTSLSPSIFHMDIIHSSFKTSNKPIKCSARGRKVCVQQKPRLRRQWWRTQEVKRSDNQSRYTHTQNPLHGEMKRSWGIKYPPLHGQISLLNTLATVTVNHSLKLTKSRQNVIVSGAWLVTCIKKIKHSLCD